MTASPQFRPDTEHPRRESNGMRPTPEVRAELVQIILTCGSDLNQRILTLMESGLSQAEIAATIERPPSLVRGYQIGFAVVLDGEIAGLGKAYNANAQRDIRKYLQLARSAATEQYLRGLLRDLRADAEASGQGGVSNRQQITGPVTPAQPTISVGFREREQLPEKTLQLNEDINDRETVAGINGSSTPEPVIQQSSPPAHTANEQHNTRVTPPLVEVAPRSAASDPEPVTPPPSPLATKVARSPTFDNQLRLAGRIVVKPEQIIDLLNMLMAVSGNEITLARAASALGIAGGGVNGALMQVKRVLDVEGYEVLPVHDGVVRLNLPALKEQFEVGE